MTLRTGDKLYHGRRLAHVEVQPDLLDAGGGGGAPHLPGQRQTPKPAASEGGSAAVAHAAREKTSQAEGVDMLTFSREEATHRTTCHRVSLLIQQFKRSGKAAGKITCPLCADGVVHARLLPKGGSEGKCTTEGCASWIE